MKNSLRIAGFPVEIQTEDKGVLLAKDTYSCNYVTHKSF